MNLATAIQQLEDKTAAPLDEVLKDLRFYDATVEPCGSRVTCNPAPTDTDEDYLVLIGDPQENVSMVVGFLSSRGFRWEGNEHYQVAAVGDFMSWRRGDVNLIVTASPAFADRHRAATFVCKRLNLMDKQDRIALFQAVLYGNQWNGTTSKEKGDDIPW